jgi:hypothetical protein
MPQRRRARIGTCRVEARQIDAVAEQVELVLGDAQVPQHVEVLGVLDQLRVGTRDHRPFE